MTGWITCNGWMQVEDMATWEAQPLNLQVSHIAAFYPSVYEGREHTRLVLARTEFAVVETVGDIKRLIYAALKETAKPSRVSSRIARTPSSHRQGG